MIIAHSCFSVAKTPFPLRNQYLRLPLRLGGHSAAEGPEDDEMHVQNPFLLSLCVSPLPYFALMAGYLHCHRVQPNVNAVAQMKTMLLVLTEHHFLLYKVQTFQKAATIMLCNPSFRFTLDQVSRACW